MEKWPFLDQNHWLNALEKCQFFDFLNVLFLQPKKAFFSFQNMVKDNFLAYLAFKKKLEKWPFLDQNHGFGKMSIFRVFELLVFIAYKGVFSVQNMVKDIFLAYIAFKKNLEKWPFLDQNHGLTPMEICQFFDILNFLFLQRRKAFFRSRIS